MLDGRPCQGATGIGRYARTVIRTVPSGDLERRYTVLSWRRQIRALGGVAGADARLVPVFPGRLFAALEAMALPLPAVGGFQLFHGTSYSVPRFARARTIGTFYDIAYRHFPQAYPPGVAEGFDRSVRRALEHVDCVVTLSNYVKEELVTAYRVDEQQVKVIYPAALLPNGDAGLRRTQARSQVNPTLLFVGEIGPRKNLTNLVEAFARIASAIPHRLVLAGPEGPVPAYVATLRSEIVSLGLSDRVRFTGWLADDELDRLYREAVAVLLPSLYEGFGYPLVDAMAHGKPLLTSNRSSMPEIAGGAALLVDPLDVEEIAEAMLVLARDDRIRRGLSAAGRRRVRDFSTETMVDAIHRLYQVLGDRRN